MKSAAEGKATNARRSVYSSDLVRDHQTSSYVEVSPYNSPELTFVHIDTRSYRFVLIVPNLPGSSVTEVNPTVIVKG
jgi:hypothetical protein